MPAARHLNRKRRVIVRACHACTWPRVSLDATDVVAQTWPHTNIEETQIAAITADRSRSSTARRRTARTSLAMGCLQHAHVGRILRRRHASWYTLPLSTDTFSSTATLRPHAVHLRHSGWKPSLGRCGNVTYSRYDTSESRPDKLPERPLDDGGRASGLLHTAQRSGRGGGSAVAAAESSLAAVPASVLPPAPPRRKLPRLFEPRPKRRREGVAGASRKGLPLPSRCMLPRLLAACAISGDEHVCVPACTRMHAHTLPVLRAHVAMP